MKIDISDNAKVLGSRAGQQGSKVIRDAIETRGQANIILATGASQFHTIEQLIAEPIDWSKVTMFHLDEYIGMAKTHPASFQKYLIDRFLSPIEFTCHYHLIEGTANPENEISRISTLISKHPIDIAFIGIGENAHLAFNDPPADFETDEPYLEVDLDEACRKQQMGEGWFASLDEVPEKAISMSIQQILKSEVLIVSVPDQRKAAAVKGAVEGPLTNLCPASILRNHNSCYLFLDRASASSLSDSIDS